MKKEIHKRIDHVLTVLGTKKKEVTDARDESENAASAFLNAGELPEEVKASDEIMKRFKEYMALEAEIDMWVSKRHADIINGVNGLPELLGLVHQDMLGFVNKIDAI
jgi:hypothetical protein